MLDIDFTFLWTAVNFVILYLILNKFVFKRVGKYMDDRANSIKDDMEKAEAANSEGEKYRDEQRNLLDSASQERKKIIAEAKAKAEAEAGAIIAGAKTEATRLISSAHEEIDRANEKSLKELQSEVASLAIKAASKVIESNMDTEKNRELVKEFLDKEGAA